MQRIEKYFIVFSLLFGTISDVLAHEAVTQTEQIRLNYLTTNEGLPQNTVDCILKDSQGFMWFGTWNGLCRYDGYTFITYNKEQQGTSLKSNFIQSLCEDQNRNLWIGTDKGLAFFDYHKLSFIDIPSVKNNLGTFSITYIIENKDKDLFIATNGNGLWKIMLNQQNETSMIVPGTNRNENPGYASSIRPSENKLFTDEYESIKIGTDKLASSVVRHVCISNDQHLLVATANGVSVIDLNGGSPKPVWKVLEEQLRGIDISVIFQDSKHNIWIGTSDAGLYHYTTSTTQMRFYNVDENNPSGLDHSSVYSIIEDLSGQIIVGTLGGLNYYNAENDNFFHFPKNSETRKYLNNPFVNALYADDLGNIWIGTEKGGVNYYSIYQKPFFAIKNDPTNKNSISHNTINSLYKEDNILWVGTAGGGLNKLNIKTNRNKRFETNPENPASISNNFIASILRDNQNNFWVGTWGGGLNLLLDEGKGSFRSYQHASNDPSTISSSYISCIEKLDEARLLIGGRGGLDIFEPGSNSFTPVHKKMELHRPFEVGCALVDSKGKVWVGTETGLYRFNRQDLLELTDKTREIEFEIFLNDENDPGSIAGNYVISLTETNDGTLWIGTYGNGICKYVNDGKNDGFVNYNENNGLCNNVAYAIEEDLNGELWISTDKGLSKFDPKNESFHNFYRNDGLLNDQFYWAASWVDKDGTMFFGGIEGLNYFTPAEIDPYPNTPQPVFTEFFIFNHPVQVGEKYHSQVVLKKPISQTELVQLSYKDAVFAIEFSALDYFLPQKIRYAYKMEGVDQDWVEVDANRRFANYTNLSGGSYVFTVKASNSDGIWSDKTSQLQILVKPPFWQTAWFRILAVLFIVLILLAYIRYRISHLKAQKRKLEIQVHERTKQIEEQKEVLEIQATNLKKTNHQLEERQMLIEGQKIELEKQNQQIAMQRDEMIELNKKVNLVTQLRLRFFTNISHEFRTPLTLIIDPLEQLQEKYKNDKNTSNTIHIINRNAQRLLHLINQLIYFRKIETGKLQLNVSRGDLVAFLQEIFSSFSDLADNQDISYEFVHNETDKQTWFDSEKTENVFYNLLSNAFKFTPVSGSIKMKIEFTEHSNPEDYPANFVAISVIDSGVGIEAKHIPHLFDRFYRVEQSKRDTDFTSSGIGLALTYEIVQALHGKINVVSTPGKGSTFTVYLPFTKDGFESNEINENAVPANINIEGRVKVLSDHIVARQSGYEQDNDIPENKHKPTVLIVEDNFDLRSFLLQTLRSDYRVLGAENGKIGLEMARKYSPELVISDVMMPVMDGMELCSRLKKTIQTSHIPVILLTAKNLVENWIEGLETGADDYIPKPFNLQILQLKMNNLIETRRKIKQLFSSPEEVAPNQFSNNILDEEFITKVYAILEKSYDQKDFSIDQLAREMCVSRSLLYKKIKALTGLNLIDFINSYKLKKAVELIRKNKQPISEVAFQVGFNDPKYFSRIFRKFYGTSPSEFSGTTTTN